MITRIGKPITKTLLQRDATWRLRVIEARAEHMPYFLSQEPAPRTCPACEDQQSIELYVDVRGATFYLCDRCNHIFSGLSPSQEFLAKYYGSKTSSQVMTYVEVSSAVKRERRELIAGPKVSFIDEVVKENRGVFSSSSAEGTWCDVGCGVGDLLTEAALSGYHALGFETDPVQATEANERGLEVIQEFLEPDSPSFHRLSTATVTSLINVLEHVPNPSHFLREIADSIQVGAFIAIEVPRHPSLSSITQRASIAPIFRHVSPPEHLHIFSDESLKFMLTSAGFEIKGRWLFGSDALEVFSNVGHVLEWNGGFDEEKVASAVNALQESIDAAGLSDTQLVVAQKNK